MNTQQLNQLAKSKMNVIIITPFDSGAICILEDESERPLIIDCASFMMSDKSTFLINAQNIKWISFNQVQKASYSLLNRIWELVINHTFDGFPLPQLEKIWLTVEERSDLDKFDGALKDRFSVIEEFYPEGI